MANKKIAVVKLTEDQLESLMAGLCELRAAPLGHPNRLTKTKAGAIARRLDNAAIEAGFRSENIKNLSYEAGM